jgi:hypothetical protein
MDTTDSLLCISNTHAEADATIRALARSGIDVKTLSLVGHGYHSEQHPVGFYTAGDRIATWGGRGALLGGLWGLLFIPAVFVLPGLGLLAAGGPIVAALFGALEGAVVVGGMSAFGAALTTVGIPKELAIEYETAMKADQYVLLLHGSRAEVAKARAVLRPLAVGQPWHRPQVAWAPVAARELLADVNA